MGEDPSAIRHEIEHTRTQMGDTVEALGYKADVPSRTRDKASSLKQKITGATPDTDDIKGGARQAVGVAQENPLGLAVAAAGVGFIAGMLIPSTRVEDRTLGPVKAQALETGQEALERGKDVAQQAAESAMETAKEAGQEQAQEMGKSTQENASEAAQQASQAATSSSSSGGRAPSNAPSRAATRGQGRTRKSTANGQTKNPNV